MPAVAQDGAPDCEQGGVSYGAGEAVQDLLQARVRDQDQRGVRTQGAGTQMLQLEYVCLLLELKMRLRMTNE